MQKVKTTVSANSGNEIRTLEYDVSTTFKQRSDNVGYKHCSDVLSCKQIRLQIEISIERTPFYGCLTKVMHTQYSS